jgi:hypothetical protein
VRIAEEYKCVLDQNRQIYSGSGLGIEIDRAAIAKFLTD